MVTDFENRITKGRKKEGERAGAAAQDRPLSSSWASFQALVRARYSSNEVCAQAGERVQTELSNLGFGVNWVLVRAHFRKGPKTVRAAGWGFTQGPNKSKAPVWGYFTL